MAAEKLLQGVIPRKAVILTAFSSNQIAASTTGAVLAKFVLPFAARLLRIDYAMLLAGAGTGGDWADDLVAKVGSDAVSEETDAFAAAGETVGSLAILKPLAEHARGTVVEVTIKTLGSSTIDNSGLSLTVLPINP